MFNYKNSVCGRFLAVSLGLMLCAGAASMLTGAHEGTWISTLLICSSVAASTAAVLLSIDKFLTQALFLILLLAVGASLYVSGTDTVLPLAPGGAYVVAACINCSFAMALLPLRASKPSIQTPGHPPARWTMSLRRRFREQAARF